MIQPDDEHKDKGGQPERTEVDDLEAPDGGEEIQGGRTPSPGGPTPIPYPN